MNGVRQRSGNIEKNPRGWMEYDYHDSESKVDMVVIMAVILFCGTIEADDAPKMIMNVVRCREFMAVFSGYEDYSPVRCV
jgi:hypothetical protein